MGKARAVSSSSSTRKMRPALSPEARENQLICLAMDCAEQQLMDRTASSQVITHFLKLGTAKYEYELEKLRKENSLMQAKTESLQSAQRSEEEYQKVLNAFKVYSGNGEPDDY